MKTAPLFTCLLAGCYATGQVPAQALRDLPGGLDSPRSLHGERLEPGTMIRAQLSNGSRTGWFAAGDLRVSGEGLMTGEPTPVSPGVRSGPGLHWDEVRELELRSLSPELSALTVPLLPFVLLIGGLDEHAFDQIMSATDGDGEHDPPPRLWSETPTRPLFTWNARRRAIVQAVATADVQATYHGDLATALAVGVRFQDFYEFSLVARPFSIAGIDGGRANVLAQGAAIGLHIDGDGDRRFALYFGFEVTGAKEPVAVTSAPFKWGPRLGLGHDVFLTVSPLNVSSIEVQAPGGPPWTLSRVVTSVELGGTL